jgi:glucose-1-phosphate cytidylyltransferase
MKVIILAGGFGTRLGEVTEKIPKPMVTLSGKPIIWHIMDLFASYGHKDFYIATGYKEEVIRKYFIDNPTNWNVNTVNTGLDTMTGGRAKLVSEHIGNEPCFLTYGDGLSNINIEKLLDFHRKNNKIATISAVRPTARFGELYLDGNIVLSFKEKPQLQKGWINGGFFVLEPKFFTYIENNQIMLEREPIEKVTEEKQMVAYKHKGFWQCMDTRRDWELLRSLSEEKIPPWKKQDE